MIKFYILIRKILVNEIKKLQMITINSNKNINIKDREIKIKGNI